MQPHRVHAQAQKLGPTLPCRAGSTWPDSPPFERDTFGLVEPIGEGKHESELLQF